METASHGTNDYGKQKQQFNLQMPSDVIKGI